MHKRVFKGIECIEYFHSGWKNHIVTVKINNSSEEVDVLKLIKSNFRISEGNYKIIRREKEQIIELIFVNI